MSVLSSILKGIVKGKVKANMGTISEKIRGKKTYVTAVVGVLVAGVGYLFGPIDLGTVQVPSVDFNTFFNIVWEALMVVFLRKGMASK